MSRLSTLLMALLFSLLSGAGARAETGETLDGRKVQQSSPGAWVFEDGKRVPPHLVGTLLVERSDTPTVPVQEWDKALTFLESATRGLFCKGSTYTLTTRTAELQRHRPAFEFGNGGIVTFSRGVISEKRGLSSFHTRYAVAVANLRIGGTSSRPDADPGCISVTLRCDRTECFEVRKVERGIERTYYFDHAIIPMRVGTDMKALRDALTAAGRRPVSRIDSEKVVAEGYLLDDIWVVQQANGVWREGGSTKKVPPALIETIHLGRREAVATSVEGWEAAVAEVPAMTANVSCTILDDGKAVAISTTIGLDLNAATLPPGVLTSAFSTMFEMGGKQMTAGFELRAAMQNLEPEQAVAIPDGCIGVAFKCKQEQSCASGSITSAELPQPVILPPTTKIVLFARADVEPEHFKTAVLTAVGGPPWDGLVFASEMHRMGKYSTHRKAELLLDLELLLESRKDLEVQLTRQKAAIALRCARLGRACPELSGR